MVDSGLVLEGGGMRGLYTAGILEYFMEKELFFPYVIGVSAGACMAASYLSRQKGRNRMVNIDYAANPEYLSLKNFLKKRQLFGMDYLFDEIPNKLVPYDYESFYKGEEDLVIGVTDCETGEPVYYSKSEYDKDILKVLRASSSLPLIAPVITYNGLQLLDGGIADPIPIKKSEREGNNKNVIILTKNRGYLKKKTTNINWLLRKVYPHYPYLIDALTNRYKLYNETISYILEQEKKGNVFIISPSQTVNVARIEKNPKKLTELYQQGYRDAMEQFDRLIIWLDEK